MAWFFPRCAGFKVERKLDAILIALTNFRSEIMSSISDFAAAQTAFNTDISNDLDAIQTQIADLNTLITTLQNSPGTISAADQATLDQLQSSGTALAAKADALSNKTPPAPPAS